MLRFAPSVLLPVLAVAVCACGVGVVDGGDGGTGGGGAGGSGSSGPGEAVLTWEAPLTNADGSPLTDLVGYRVYLGTASAAYDPPVDVGSVLSHHLTGLTSAVRYYFAVTAYDTSGNESIFSNEVSKDIQ